MTNSQLAYKAPKNRLGAQRPLLRQIRAYELIVSTFTKLLLSKDRFLTGP